MTDARRAPDSAAFDRARQAQAAAANPDLSAWVEANAGSGKTKVLIDRVARLLLRRPDGRPGASPDSILCITYTKAAANEMLSRLFTRLGDWSVADDPALKDQLANLEDRPPDAYTHEHLREARALFARALETPGGLRIETIHAFCARILRRFPLEAGVPPGFVEIEEDEANALWQTVLADRLESAADAHPGAMQTLSRATGGLGIGAALDALRPKRQALYAFSSSLHDEADLEQRIRHAVDADDASVDEILQDAMSEQFPRARLEDAIDALRGLDRPGQTDLKLLDALTLVLGTEDLDRRYDHYMSALAGAKRDFPSGSNPYTAKAGALVADLFCRKSTGDMPEGSEITRLKAVQNRLAKAEAAARSIALMQIGLPMIRAYNAEKRQRAALDFDDLIDRVRHLLTRSNAAEWVLYKLDGGLSHLLLDEAQDTSPPQWALINALVQEFQAGLGRKEGGARQTLFVVGDPKQSIYSFQGADQQQFEAEKGNFVTRESRIAKAEDRAVNQPEMAMSFRSTPEVLRFVDEVRARVPLSDAATDPLPPVDADLRPHDPHRADQPGRVELWPLEHRTGNEAETDAWTTPTDHVPADAPRRRLARNIARKVRTMIDHGESVWKPDADGKWLRKPVQAEDILILVRSRNELFEALIESLKQENVAVAGADRLRLLDNLGVQDCLNLIRFALQPADDLTLAEILRGPFCGLVDDDRYLFPLAHHRDKGLTLWQSLAARRDTEFADARTFCLRLIANRHMSAFDFLTRALTARDRAGLSGWDKLIQRLGEPVRDPVQALLSRALKYDMSDASSLQAFLADTETRSTELKRELGEPDQAVRVMTVHGAKGLQSPVVILPDTTGATKPVSDPLFFTADGTPLYSPSSSFDCPASAALREAANIAGERESRRLLYVALTRASDQLIIAGAGLGNVKAGYARSSWYRWCLTAMRALTGGSPDADAPDECLAFGAPPVCIAHSEDDAIETAPAPGWLSRPAEIPAPPQRLAAPSRLIQDRAAVLAPFGPDRSAALKRGRLIHALLQTLPELAPDQREIAGRRFLSRDEELAPDQLEEMLDVTLRTLNDPDFANLFSSHGRNEAAIVGTLPHGQIVNGRVDRLIIQADRIVILDFKTDRPAPRNAEAVDLSYKVQMAAYRAVLQAMYPDRPVTCALLYTDGPRLIELDGQSLSESLNRVESRV